MSDTTRQPGKDEDPPLGDGNRTAPVKEPPPPGTVDFDEKLPRKGDV
jgi:hypothetical protein